MLALSNQRLKKWAWCFLNFIYLCCILSKYQRKPVLKLQKIYCTNIFTIEVLIFAYSVQMLTLTNHRIRRLAWNQLKFIYSSYLQCGNQGKIVLKVQKLRWTNLFIIKIFIFANFEKNIDFERSQLRKMGVVLAKFYLYESLLFRALEESCFKVLKVPLNKYH